MSEDPQQTLINTIRDTFAYDWRTALYGEYHTIRSKTTKLIPFFPNKEQDRMIDVIWENWKNDRPTWIVVVKDRQPGISTGVAMIFDTIAQFTEGISCIMLADEAKNSNKIFRMHKLTHGRFDPDLRSTLKANNARILEFEETASIIEVDTAESNRPAQSGTYQLVHASEVAHYTHPEDTMLSLLQVVPPSGRTIVIVESTANGVGNYYYNLVMAAHKGENQYTLLFFSFVEHDEYSMPLPDGYILLPEESGRYGDELAVIKSCIEYGITDPRKQLEKLYWRRWTIINKCNNDLNNFRQEYPISVEDAFIGSGQPVFNHQLILELESLLVSMPKYAGAIDRYDKEKKIEEHIHVTPNGHGNLKIWHQPEQSDYDNRYLICADTGGVWEKADYSVAYVLDRVKRRIVATLHGHIDAYEYSDQLIALSYYYSDYSRPAMIAPEINKWASETDDQGKTVIDYLKKQGARLYTRKIYDDQAKVWTTKIGWHTNSDTKGKMIDTLRKYVNSFEEIGIICNDKKILDEMRTYIISETKTGKTAWEAQEGCKDDRVMAFGICLVLDEELPKPERVIKTHDLSELYNGSKSISQAFGNLSKGR